MAVADVSAVGSVADAVTAALELAKRDPEAQRVATASRVELRNAARVAKLAEDYGDAVARAAFLHGLADGLDRRVEVAVDEHRTHLAGIPLPTVVRRAALRRRQAAERDGEARAALLALLALGITEADLDVVDRRVEAHKAGASA